MTICLLISSFIAMDYISYGCYFITGQHALISAH